MSVMFVKKEKQETHLILLQPYAVTNLFRKKSENVVEIIAGEGVLQKGSQREGGEWLTQKVNK